MGFKTISLILLFGACTYVSFATSPAAHTIPFNQSHGLIFLEAEILDEVGYVVFDTGADELILNQTTSNKLDAFQTLSGVAEAGVAHVDKVRLGNLNLIDIDAYTMDLQELELLTNKRILGILGSSFLEDWTIHIDHASNQIRLNNRFEERKLREKKYIKTDFYLEAGMPLLNIEIEGKQYLVGLDTGASISFMAQKHKAKIKNLGYTRDIILQTASNSNKENSVFSLERVKLNSHAFSNFEISFQNFSSLNQEMEIELDGILSLNQLGMKEVIFDFQAKNLYLIQ